MKSLVSKQEEAEGLRLAAAQPESGAEFLTFLERLRARLVAAVSEEESVRSRLDGHRSRVVGVDYREDKVGGHARRLAEVGLYDYDSNVLLVAIVDPRAGELLDLEAREGIQPPITDEERAAAIAIAGRADSTSLSQSITEQVVAFPTPTHRLSGERASHRCCSLFIPSERTPGKDLEIVVDLSTEDVVPNSELRPEPTGSASDPGGES